MTNIKLVEKLQWIVNNFRTVYMWGVFGAPVTEELIALKAAQYPDWYDKEKRNELKKKVGKGYFAFDCVNLIKSVLWGWAGDKTRPYGGAEYLNDGVPDINANQMIDECHDVSDDFKNIMIGEAVWMPGHIGIYIGNGKVIECTTRWSGDVQTTACLNIGPISGLNGRKWTKHGKLPYVEYIIPSKQKPTVPPVKEKTHVVEKGDSLWHIALEYLGNGNRYKEIKTLNKLKSDTLQVGQVLKIPPK